MADDQLDKLRQSWLNLRRAVNERIPDLNDRVRAVRVRIGKLDPPGPGK